MLLSNEIQSGCEAGIYQPLLAYILAKKMGRTLPNYSPQFKYISLQKLARLALLYSEAGFRDEAGKLCDLLDHLEPFPSLWCRDQEYNPSQWKSAYEKLSLIERIPNDLPIDVSIIDKNRFTGALTTSGNGTSLGVIHFRDIEIRAFGPQSQSLAFGIRGSAIDAWTETQAIPEVWLRLEHTFENEILKLKFHLVGLKPTTPLYLAFYVKARRAEVENKTFSPKSLERYKGVAKAVSFESSLTIQPCLPLNVEVIPLAGEGCFWDANFLISFEINNLLNRISFSLIN